MMAGCFSPPGGGGGAGDPWGHEFDDERFYRMSARKFNKHMAEKRRRCRINTALERLKYIILHVMRRNPEHFDKMEKADILDLTVKFLKAIQKHQSLSAAQRSATTQSSQRSTPASTGYSRPTRAINIYHDPEVPEASTSGLGESSSHHKGKERPGVGLKCRSGNIPSAAVRAVQDCIPSQSSPKARSDRPSDIDKGLDYRKRPAPTDSDIYSSSAKRSAIEGDFSYPINKERISATVSSAAGRPEPDVEKEDSGNVTFGHNLEYRLHSAFHLQPRDAHWPPTLFCPVPKRPHTSPSSSGASSGLLSTAGCVSASRSGRQLSPDGGALYMGPSKASISKPRLGGEKVDDSKTKELKIEIPGSKDESVPPLQPAAARGPDSPHYALPLPGLMTSQVWRPW